jgi:hypothetical protein
MHWPEPVRVGAALDNAGPVLVTIEYDVIAAEREAFLAGISKVANERRRDGSYDWGIFEDTAHPGRMLETFYVDSWDEHLRQHQRVTRTDQLVEDDLRKYLHASPKITHYLAARATQRQHLR